MNTQQKPKKASVAPESDVEGRDQEFGPNWREHFPSEAQGKPESSYAKATEDKLPQWYGAYDSEGKLRAIFESESEAYHYVRNRGHMDGGSDKPIVNHADLSAVALRAKAEALAEALRDLFEHCAMIHKQWGEASNQQAADAAISQAHKALANWEGVR